MDVRKSFGETEVLRGFSLTVEEGETVVIIGASGAGKSVTLKHIVRLLRPDAGEVWVDGLRVGGLDQEELYELRRKVGYAFQFAALFDSMTVGENVAMGLRRMGTMDDAEIRERVVDSLGLVDLDGFEDRMPADLSGGERKRAGFARAIAIRPKYLLYDEPTTGLDPITATVVDRLMIRMREELGVTGIAVSHNMTSAFRVADRVAMLHRGRIRAVGTPDEIRAVDDPVVRGFIEGEPELLADEGPAAEDTPSGSAR